MSAGIFTGIGPTALGAAGRPSSSEGETLATRSRVGCTLRAAPARSANYLLAAMEPRPQPQSRLTSRWCHGLGSCRCVSSGSHKGSCERSVASFASLRPSARALWVIVVIVKGEAREKM